MVNHSGFVGAYATEKKSRFVAPILHRVPAKVADVEGGNEHTLRVVSMVTPQTTQPPLPIVLGHP
jgi:hypothetical protein